MNGTAWESIHKPGIWTYVFCMSGDQAKGRRDRIKIAVAEMEPWMVKPMIRRTARSWCS